MGSIGNRSSAPSILEHTSSKLIVVEREEGAYEYGVGAYANWRCGGYIFESSIWNLASDAAKGRILPEILLATRDVVEL
jgi:hypothetical protein